MSEEGGSRVSEEGGSPVGSRCGALQRVLQSAWGAES